MGKLFEDGHTVEIKPVQRENNIGKIWYQSHFCVNVSKKFCVVFDCSMKFKNVSVNDFVYKGHGMRNSFVGVLTRFRKYLPALISDIRKLYYQCVVTKEDQDFSGIKIMIFLC